MRPLPVARPLNAGIVVRRPTPAELTHRQPFTLTPRDRAILVWTHFFGFLTTDLIELAYFPPVGPARQSPSSCAYDRLRQLWLWGYLERVELPQARSAGGRLPYLYSLGRQGVPVVEERVPGPVSARRIDRLDALFVDHNLKTAALWANLTRAGLDDPDLRIRRTWWWGERQLRGKRLQVMDRAHRRRLAFLPDGMVKVEYADGRTQLAAIEIDEGHLSSKRFRRKLEAFEQFVATEGVRRVFQEYELDVWVLAPSQGRLDSLLWAVQQTVDLRRRGCYFLTTFETLDPSRFLQAEWVDGEETVYRSPLLGELPDLPTMDVEDDSTD